MNPEPEITPEEIDHRALIERTLALISDEQDEAVKSDLRALLARIASPELAALGEAAEYWVRENDLKQNTISADIKLFDAARTYAASVKG